MGDHVPPPSRHAEEDTIEQIVETDRHEAEFGRKVLLELSKVDNTPKLTFRNVIRSTDGLTILNCIALTMCYTSAIMEYNVPPSQIPFIIADLGRPELASWLSTASTVATCATLPTMSSFTDVFGRRYALLFGCGLGTAGALLSGFAPSTKVIMVGQVGEMSTPKLSNLSNCCDARLCLAPVLASPLSLPPHWQRLYPPSPVLSGVPFSTLLELRGRF